MIKIKDVVYYWGKFFLVQEIKDKKVILDNKVVFHRDDLTFTGRYYGGTSPIHTLKNEYVEEEWKTFKL